MKSEVQSITEKALRLSPSARAYIAETLLQSLDFEEDFPIPDDWMAEIHKRCHEIDNGDVELVSGEKAMDHLREKYS